MVLIIVMMVAVLLLIAMTAVLPSVYQEGQREREEELIFRGTQYGKAVALFHKQFGRYPTEHQGVAANQRHAVSSPGVSRSHGPQGEVAIHPRQCRRCVAGFHQSTA